MGGTRGYKGLIINNYPTSEIIDSVDIGLHLEISLLE